jgi:outer membrane cobalamin receptor
VKARYLLSALVLLQLAAWSSAPAQTRRRSDVITQEEIEKATANNAYDLLRQLRPAWFRTRGVVSTRDVTAGGLAFYVDGIRLSSMEELESLAPDRIKEARYLKAIDATTKYGTDHPSGAVEIVTKR